MRHVNPFPSQFPEVRRKPSSRIYLSICFEGWILYVTGALFGIAVLTFDLATDWMLWRLLSSLWLYDVFRRSGPIRGVLAFIDPLPVLCLVFLSLATALYVSHVIYFGVQFRNRRIRFRSKADGVPLKSTILQKYADDLFVGGHLLIRNIPINALLFYLQINISCRFYFIFYDDAIVVTSLVGTCVGIVLHCCTTAWKSGCFGRRTRDPEGLLLIGIRIVNCVMICSVLCLVTVNFLLVAPTEGVYNLPESQLVRKICLDRWTASEYVAFTIAVDEYFPDPDSAGANGTNGGALFSYNGTEMTDYRNIIKLKVIYERGHVGASLELKHNRTNLEKAFSFVAAASDATHDVDVDGDVTPTDCLLAFRFVTRVTDGHVTYRMSYRCRTDDADSCLLRPINAAVVASYSATTAHRRLLILNGSDPENPGSGVRPYIIPPVGISGDQPDVIKVFRPRVSLLGKLQHKNTQCNIDFISDEHLSLPNTVC